jgi:hypothetical protein
VLHLSKVFHLLLDHQWKVKLSKCSFAKRQISYLGYIISEEGIATCPRKIKAVVDWPTPASVKDFRSFLGLAGYYRRFIKHFGILAKPLNDLLKRNNVFVWADDQEMAFQTLKLAMMEAHVLALPNFNKPFYIETDACDYGVGAMLMQDRHPITYVSKV